MKWNITERFRRPFEYAFPKLAEKYKEEKYNQKVVSAFRRALNTSDGDIIMQYLVQYYRLDEELGGGDNRHITSQQDVVKHILSLIN